MDEKTSMHDVLKLRELEVEHEDKHAFKSIAWVIGVVIVLAIIVFWLRSHHKETCDQHRHESGSGGHISRLYDLEGQIKSIAPQVARLNEHDYYNHGEIDRLQAEFCQKTKNYDYEIGRLNHRCYPDNYILEDSYHRRDGRRGESSCGCNDHHGNCGKKFIRRDTYTPNTQEVVVTEDCNCG